MSPADDVLTPDDPPTTKEGWRRFVDYQPEGPALITAEQRLACPAANWSPMTRPAANTMPNCRW
ncbi:MAG TPA: hypothetical protein VN408_18360 [Actinoplanes sp.]|nr:hypothetical protein [Actinoplanes sp.]